mgnify:CR=1 FL=1
MTIEERQSEIIGTNGKVRRSASDKCVNCNRCYVSTYSAIEQLSLLVGNYKSGTPSYF